MAQWTIGTTSGDKCVARNADGRLEVFSRHYDDSAQMQHLWHIWQMEPGGVWSDWHSLGGPLGFEIGRGSPEVFQNADGRLEVFAFGSDEALWHIWQDPTSGTGWSEWESLGDKRLNPRAAVFRNADGRLEVFSRGYPDYGLWHIWQDPTSGTAWSDWSLLDDRRNPIQMEVTGDPEVFQNADGRLEVFAQGFFDALWHIWQTAPNSSAWSGWHSLGRPFGSPLTGRPVACQNADGRLEVFAMGDSEPLWHIWQMEPGGDWSDWHSLGGESGLDTVVCQNLDGRLEAFVSLDVLWHIWQMEPGGDWSDWHSLGRA